MPLDFSTFRQQNLQNLIQSNDDQFKDQLILLGSKCNIGKNERSYLKELMKSKKFITKLIYRGSRDGWKSEDFHSRCDDRGPTISLFQIKDEDCIGGFIKTQWSSSGDSYGATDDDAMLFNLSRFRHFPSQQSKLDIWHKREYGPVFAGIENFELAQISERLCISNYGYSGYNIPLDANGVNMLTNRQGNEFTISELEVWEVIYI